MPEIPLEKEIEDRFGNYFIMSNDNNPADIKKYIIVTKYAVKTAEQDVINYTVTPFCPLLAWDEETKLFWFNDNKYTISQFKKVLELLVFI